jgi:hypothetical protein
MKEENTVDMSVKVKLSFDLTDEQSQLVNDMYNGGIDCAYGYDYKYKITNFKDDLVDHGAVDYEINHGYISVDLESEVGSIDCDIEYFEQFMIAVLGK